MSSARSLSLEYTLISSPQINLNHRGTRESLLHNCFDRVWGLVRLGRQPRAALSCSCTSSCMCSMRSPLSLPLASSPCSFVGSIDRNVTIQVYPFCIHGSPTTHSSSTHLLRSPRWQTRRDSQEGMHARGCGSAYRDYCRSIPGN